MADMARHGIFWRGMADIGAAWQTWRGMADMAWFCEHGYFIFQGRHYLRSAFDSTNGFAPNGDKLFLQSMQTYTCDDCMRFLSIMSFFYLISMISPSVCM